MKTSMDYITRWTDLHSKSGLNLPENQCVDLAVNNVDPTIKGWLSLKPCLNFAPLQDEDPLCKRWCELEFLNQTMPKMPRQSKKWATFGMELVLEGIHKTTELITAGTAVVTRTMQIRDQGERPKGISIHHCLNLTILSSLYCCNKMSFSYHLSESQFLQA